LKITKRVILSTLLVFYGIVYAKSPVKLLPDELLDVAEKCDCEQIDNFFDRPGMVEPPYVYGFLAGDKENSAVFWCKKKKEKRKYLLVLVSRRTFREPWKFELITETRNFPGGLSIVSNLSIPLHEFRYVNDVKTRGPKGVMTSDAVISSYYDGLMTLFYNHNGEWLLRMYD